MASFNKKLAAYSSAAVAVGGAYTGAAHAALVTSGPFSGGLGTAINDNGGAPVGYYETASTTPPTAGDTGTHAYLKLNGNTTGAGKDNPAFVVTASGDSGVLVNLLPGAVVGPSTGATYSSNTFYNSGTSQNSDLGYFDTTTGAPYTPAGNTTDQFKLGTTGYVGVEFNAGGGSTLDYGYITLSIDPTTQNVTSTLTYDDAGAAVTVPGGTTVPEPASLGILALGTLGLVRRKRT